MAMVSRSSCRPARGSPPAGMGNSRGQRGNRITSRLLRHVSHKGGRDRNAMRATLGEEFPTRTLSVCAAGS
jgi:hypothetical protein